MSPPYFLPLPTSLNVDQNSTININTSIYMMKLLSLVTSDYIRYEKELIFCKTKVHREFVNSIGMVLNTTLCRRKIQGGQKQPILRSFKTEF